MACQLHSAQHIMRDIVRWSDVRIILSLRTRHNAAATRGYQRQLHSHFSGSHSFSEHFSDLYVDFDSNPYHKLKLIVFHCSHLRSVVSNLVSQVIWRFGSPLESYDLV